MFTGEQYSVKLPWRAGKFNLPENRKLAEGHLKGQLKRLRKTPELLEAYDEVIQKQKHDGIVEPAPKEPTGERITYIPHQAIIRENAETTKLRIVYDASAKLTKGSKSLNDCLHTGPSLTPLLYDVLLRSRMYPILLTGDIRQAFLQIKIDPTDRDVLRFLWLKDLNGPQEEIEELRFTCAIFGAGPSPYSLGGTVEHHLKKYEDDDRAIVKKIRDSLYVDDFIGGENTSQATMNLKEKEEMIFKEGGFTMAKWKTNNKEVHSQLNGSEFGSDQTKILGIAWNPETDEISIGIHQPTTNIITKRTLLSELSKTFDPLGIVGPMIMKARLLLQELCHNQVGWDDPLTDEQKEISKNG